MSGPQYRPPVAQDPSFDPTPGRITPYAELDETLLDHARALREALGDDFIGLYPTGSP